MTLDVGSLKIAALAATLRSCQLFTGLPLADLETVAAFSSLRNLGRGQHLFREGEAVEGFFVVQKGAVSVHRVSASGKEQVIAVFRAGESFAEAALASQGGYPAHGRALEASAVVFIPRAPFLGLLGRRPDLALRMLGAMSTHLRVLVGLVEDLTLKDVETRLLHWMAKRLPEAPAPGPCALQLGSTKRTLAAELGTSSETLSRTFARLREAGLIEVKGRTVRVLRCAELRERFQRLMGLA